VSLRFFTVYGPRQRPDMAFHIFLRALFQGRPLEIYGEGNQTRDFTFVSDIVEGIVLAMKGRDGAVYNLGGGSRVSLLEAIRSLESASRCEAHVQGEAVQAGDVKHTWADLSLATDELGLRRRGCCSTRVCGAKRNGCESCVSDASSAPIALRSSQRLRRVPARPLRSMRDLAAPAMRLSQGGRDQLAERRSRIVEAVDGIYAHVP